MTGQDAGVSAFTTRAICPGSMSGTPVLGPCAPGLGSIGHAAPASPTAFHVAGSTTAPAVGRAAGTAEALGEALGEALADALDGVVAIVEALPEGLGEADGSGEV